MDSHKLPVLIRNNENKHYGRLCALLLQQGFCVLALVDRSQGQVHGREGKFLATCLLPSLASTSPAHWLAQLHVRDRKPRLLTTQLRGPSEGPVLGVPRRPSCLRTILDKHSSKRLSFQASQQAFPTVRARRGSSLGGGVPPAPRAQPSLSANTIAVCAGQTHEPRRPWQASVWTMHSETGWTQHTPAKSSCGRTG